MRPQSKADARKERSCNGRRSRRFLCLLLAGSLFPFTASTAVAGPPPATPFEWPKVPTAPAHAPNVLLILTDDVGFGASSTFGGPIATPTFDQLASRGLRYNNFHTAAVCSATRAALLTGRNQHDVGMGGGTTDGPQLSNGYTTILPKNAASVAEILRENGYNTAAFGKWHLVPQWEESAAGPFDRWPTGKGFEYFYGFLNGETSQYAPQLFNGITPVEPPTNEPGYILDRDLAGHAIQWIANHNAVAHDKPFFIYYAPGTAHSPLHAPQEWIDRYRGKFDEGWDALRVEILKRQKRLGIVPPSTKLSARPAMLPAWNRLTAEQKRVYAHMMEVYAAALSYCDDQIGQVIDTLRREGQLDNTLIIYIQGDNGSSAEGGFQGLWNETTVMNGVPEDFAMIKDRLNSFGGPRAYNHFPAAWANAMSTPFPYFKRIASHLGAHANGLVVSWPAQMPARGIRHQFHHVIDIMPTILEAAGITAPDTVNGVAQKPIEGVGMKYTFDAPNAPTRRRTQYFEVTGGRALYHEGWLAAVTPVRMPWEIAPWRPFDPAAMQWELYDLNADFSQSTDVARQHPGKLRELQAMFDREAYRNQVYPLIPQGGRPPWAEVSRDVFTYTMPVNRVPSAQAPNILNRSFEIAAKVDIPTSGGDGVLVAQGGRFGGYSLFIRNGIPTFAYNMLGLETTEIKGAVSLTPGQHDINLRFRYDGGGAGKAGAADLLVDGIQVGEGRIPRTIPMIISLSETFDVGSDTGTPVSAEYGTPFAFKGHLIRLSVQPE
nr:arylsulfatase [Sphingomonas sp. CDS-1]